MFWEAGPEVVKRQVEGDTGNVDEAFRSAARVVEADYEIVDEKK
jgi:hypothetical protein